MHYYRMRRTGGLGDRVVTGRTMTSNGYVLIRVPMHKLARSSGWALEHRVVLHDSIGPGEHLCHWCKTTVNWDRRYPESLDALVVDHVDRATANNDVSNLVPSCAACNFKRGPAPWDDPRLRSTSA